MSKYTTSTVACAHCGNISFMVVKGSVDDTVTRGSAEVGYEDSGTVYDILGCPACNEVTVMSYYWHDGMSEAQVVYKILYPQDREFPIGLPENILTSLKAAEKVKPIDAHAYALLLGRTLELVCYDRGAKGDTLYPMLKDLADKGEIPEKLVNVASGLRQFRNVGAHAGLGDLSTAELPIARALCDALLEYIYSAPHLAALAESKLNRIKKKKA